MKLTSRENVETINSEDLFHIVSVNNTSQDPNGSSFKAKIGDLFEYYLKIFPYKNWVSGSTGSYSIKTVNDSGLDATNDYAISEGFATQANGIVSHAEGYGTVAYGDFSHSQGKDTKAFGVNSYAGGYDTVAEGVTSFVYGENSTAYGDYSVVLGKNIYGTKPNTTYVDKLNIKTVGVYIDNNDAIANGLEIGEIYRTSTGQLMIRY